MANALNFYGLEEPKETEKFARMFDKLFDLLNICCISASIQHRKPDLRPYRSPDDERLKVRLHVHLLHLFWGDKYIHAYDNTIILSG